MIGSSIGEFRRLRRGLLGINRRNHQFLFGYNARGRYRVADDKRATKIMLAQHGIAAPLLHAACAAHWEIGRIGALLATLPAFVLKPARGAGGAGIMVVAGRDGDRFRTAAGAVLSWLHLESHIADVLAGVFASTGFDDALMVESLVRSEATLAAVAYQGVPDLRILVFRGVPLLAMLRLPTRASDGRANLHLGGIGVGIDLERGLTTQAVCGGRRVTRHPDLDAALEGVTIPQWRAVLELAAHAAAAAELGFLGVDVVIDADRGPLVLELNARPGLAIQAANARGLRPLLAAAATATIPPTTPARVELGQRLFATTRRGT